MSLLSVIPILNITHDDLRVNVIEIKSITSQYKMNGGHQFEIQKRTVGKTVTAPVVSCKVEDHNLRKDKTRERITETNGI